ncbi:hypothetical protein Tco_0764407 [Tanacetum coccineum]
MLLCKQAEKGVPLQVEQADWLEDTDEEIDEQELEAHYSFMAKIWEVPTADSRTDTELLEQVQNNAEYNMFAIVRHHSEQSESTSITCLVEKDDSNVTPDSPDIFDTTVPSQQELDLLFGPLYDEFFTAGTSSVNNSSSPTDNSKQLDTPPTTNIQSSIKPTNPTNVNAKENNDNQAADT